MIARLKAWWQRLVPLNEEDAAYLSAYQNKAARDLITSKARTKRLERALTSGPRHGTGNPVADMLRGDWPEQDGRR
jgi:hypothetical protein